MTVSLSGHLHGLRIDELSRQKCVATTVPTMSSVSDLKGAVLRLNQKKSGVCLLGIETQWHNNSPFFWSLKRLLFEHYPTSLKIAISANKGSRGHGWPTERRPNESRTTGRQYLCRLMLDSAGSESQQVALAQENWWGIRGRWNETKPPTSLETG